MNAFSGNLNNLDRRSPRRIKRLVRLLMLALILAVGAAAAVGIPAAVRNRQTKKIKLPPNDKILSSWSGKDYDAVQKMCEEGLQTRPLDSFYLVLNGFASFYKGIAETDGEIRLQNMDKAVFSLRKALASSSIPFRSQVLYVLGKAYYHKGPFYLDEAIRFLESASTEGYSADDALEYMAVAYSELGDYGKSVEAFEKALGKKKTDLLLLAAAKAYMNFAQPDKAETAALEALSMTEDSLVREKSRFLLGELYVSRKDLRQAEEQYGLILEMNPESADAHYYLGLIWQEKGDAVRARAEWRKAVSLDPMHTAARQKLAERI